jgi:hypothetical protein
MEILDLFNDRFQPKNKTFQTDVTNENKKKKERQNERCWNRFYSKNLTYK